MANIHIVGFSLQVARMVRGRIDDLMAELEVKEAVTTIDWSDVQWCDKKKPAPHLRVYEIGERNARWLGKKLNEQLDLDVEVVLLLDFRAGRTGYGALQKRKTRRKK